MAEPIDLSKKRSESAINLDHLPPADRVEASRMNNEELATFFGMGGKGRKPFDVPRYLSTESEKVIDHGNSFIVLGLDRPANRLSGFGGKGNTHCASVDIVAGRLGFAAISKTNDGQDVLVNPNFKLDAARLYLSQKADVDNYFGLVEGTVGNTSPNDPRSAAALKADTVRIIGRENIKLVTRTDVRNSQGADTNNVFMGQYGINLIAMNDDADMQPLVKGDNLLDCLSSIVDSIASLRGLFENFLEYNRNMVNALMTHTHTSPFYGIDTAPDFKSVLPESIEYLINNTLNVEVPCMLQHMQETNNIISEYISNEGGFVSDKFILSKYNSTN